MPHSDRAIDTHRSTSPIQRRRPILFTVLVAALLSLASGMFSSPASAGDTVPYSDPNAKGVIGFCDRGGHSIDHGRVSDLPFVWAAVSSQAAPPDYSVDGRTATLFGFQPRQGVDPGQWSGQMLTASSRYDNPSYPKAQATDGDDSLADFLAVFPAKWHGLVQLRLYLGAPGKSPLTLNYAATDIQVSGDTWTVARGGSVSCTASNATSIEQIYNTAPTTTSATAASGTAKSAPSAGSAGNSDSSVAAGSGTAAASSGSTGVSGAARPRANAPSSDNAAAQTSSRNKKMSSGDRTPLVLILLAVLVAALASASVWVRLRRRRAGGPPGLEPDPDDPTTPVLWPENADDREDHDVAVRSGR